MTVATYAAAQLLRVLPRARITRAVGRLVDARVPAAITRTVVRVYTRAYGVDLDEAVQREGFASFDAFFTRQLRDGARPQPADPSVVVSPADGRIEAIGPVEKDGRFLIKGREYRADELLGDEGEARRYQGGQFAVVYLSPRDYHRVHSPVAGTIHEIRSLPGDLYPVNSIGERHVPSLFSINRRVSIPIDVTGSAGEPRGRVTVVMVGAMIVGRITVSGIDERDVSLGTHRLSPPRRVGRGEEIGMFHLGSTAVVFAEPGFGGEWRHGVGPVLFGESMLEPRPRAGAATPSQASPGPSNGTAAYGRGGG
jgi:phosphatidylserine decarboxylase